MELSEKDDAKLFGFWVYLMTDLVIFGVLFATFAVLRDSTFGGPSGKEIFKLSSAFLETMILLTSSFTCAIATLMLHRRRKNPAIGWFSVTFALGVAFLAIEILEFSELISEGNGPSRSGFLSSYFILVGTHGFHITIGLLWMGVALFSMGFRGLLEMEISKTLRLAQFWHFLDVVWIFIFSIVYIMAFI